MYVNIALNNWQPLSLVVYNQHYKPRANRGTFFLLVLCSNYWIQAALSRKR